MNRWMRTVVMYTKPDDTVMAYMPQLMIDLTHGDSVTMFFISDYRGLRLTDYPTVTDRVCGHIELRMTTYEHSYSIATNTTMYNDYHINQNDLTSDLLQRIQYAWAMVN